MKLIHDARAHLDPSMPMPQQLPQIPILCIRDPDPGKTIFHQNLQQQLRFLAIGLLLPHSHPTQQGIDLDGRTTPVDVEVWCAEGVQDTSPSGFGDRSSSNCSYCGS
jgi:hypothetical protein